MRSKRFPLTPLSIGLYAALGLMLTPLAVAQSASNSGASPNASLQELELTTVEDSASDKPGLNLGPIDIRSAVRSDLSEALNILPSVRVDNTASSSLQQADIQPAEFSIRGSAPYQNNIQLDNSSIDSFLDPANKLKAGETPSRTQVSGHSQSLFIDPRFLSNIEVIDSIASAKEGGFTGGVVKAETRGYEGFTTATISHRLTKDDWTKFHIDEDQVKLFNDGAAQLPTGTPGAFQPKFDKSETSISGATRFGNIGVFAGFSDKRSQTIQKQSSINAIFTDFPYFLETGNVFKRGDEKKQDSRSQFLTARIDLLEASYDLYATLAYSNSFTDSFLINYLNSDFTREVEGFNAAVNYGDNFDNTRVDAVLAVNISNNERDTLINSIDNYTGRLIFNGTALNGNLGDLQNNQQVISGNLDFATELSDNMRVNYGVQLKHIDVEQQRKNDFIDIKHNPISQSLQNGAQGDIPYEEHHFIRKVTYAAGDIGDSIVNAALYTEVDAQAQQFFYRAGARLERDGLLGNVDLAHRLSAGMYLNDEQSFTVELGVNRYYGKSFASFILREEERKFVTTLERESLFDPNAPVTEINQADEWLPSDLKTAYNDEFALKFALANDYGTSNLNIVQRKGKDQVRTRFDSETELKRFTNDGANETSQAEYLWSSNNYQWAASNWKINASLSVTKTRTDARHIDGGYQQTNSPDPREFVIFEGESILSIELPASDFSVPVKAKIDIFTNTLGDKLFVTNSFTHTNGYESLREMRRDEETNLRTFAVLDQGSTLRWDVSVEYQFMDSNSSPYVKLDVINLTNADNIISASGGNALFGFGRQYWLEVGYRF